MQEDKLIFHLQYHQVHDFPHCKKELKVTISFNKHIFDIYLSKLYPATQPAFPGTFHTSTQGSINVKSITTIKTLFKTKTSEDQ